MVVIKNNKDNNNDSCEAGEMIAANIKSNLPKKAKPYKYL